MGETVDTEVLYRLLTGRNAQRRSFFPDWGSSGGGGGGGGR